MRYRIQNELIECEIDSHGAELKSLIRKSDGREIMWDADPAFWNRTSPVLFPFVGGLKDKEYRYNGKTYTIGQHGFARDMEFDPDPKNDGEIWFSLIETPESLEKYPFRFRLKIGYRIEQASVRVMWEVENTNAGDMWFAIGAHPGFAVEKLEGCVFRLYDRDGRPVFSIENRVFGGKGCVTDNTTEIKTPEGILAISEKLFDNDALVLENSQIGMVELVDKDQKLVAAVEFDAPLVGLWSPPHKNAPFVCIEPWYGRCDSESFTGSLEDRDYEQKLGAGEFFISSYIIKT